MKAERWCEVGVSCCVRLAVYGWLCTVGCVQLAAYSWLRTVGCVQYDLWRHVDTMQGCIPEKAWKIGHVAPCVYHVGVYTPKSLGNSDGSRLFGLYFFSHSIEEYDGIWCFVSIYCISIVSIFFSCRLLLMIIFYSIKGIHTIHGIHTSRNNTPNPRKSHEKAGY